MTETALSTALNAYFAERVSEFAIVMGVALLLTGIGFLVLTLSVLRGRRGPRFRRRDRRLTGRRISSARRGGPGGRPFCVRARD